MALLEIFLFLCTVSVILSSRTVHSIPFVVFHGEFGAFQSLVYTFMGASESCEHGGVTHFTKVLSNWSGSPGYCIEIGNGIWDSWTVPFRKQTAIACKKVKKMGELSDGYNIIGLSQGNIVGRGVIEFCDGGPPVRNLISLAGPHAGIASVPFCGSTLVCILVDFLIQLAVYTDFVQEHLAPANYIKIPTDLSDYKDGCKFLPKLNNEFHQNPKYKERFSSLQNLVLIMFEKDSVLVPKETSWFGYFPDNSWDTLLSAQQTTLYTEDWIGLKKLDEAGRVKFVKASGSHLEISYDEIEEHIFPYLLENSTARHRSSKLSHLRLLSGHDKNTIKLY
ncbi:uncharacterized protein [Primulina eburnea]|uniref:uncharacterized protein isoform X1 n=1 Tax=Primulina eburnea TaxID=1245227 RepID=UPI003C6C3DA6